MRRLLRLARAIDRVSRGAGTVTTWLTLAMVLIGAYNAIVRSVEREMGLSLSSNAYVELQWYLFSLVFLFGAPYALRCDRHVRVDVLYGGHSLRVKAWIDLAGGVLFLIPFCLVAIWTSISFVVNSWGDISNDPGGLLRYPLKAAIPLAFFLLALQGLSEVIKRLGLLRGLSPEEVGLEEIEPPRTGGDGA